jgi:hypothetical protein
VEQGLHDVSGTSERGGAGQLTIDPIVFMQPLHLMPSAWQEHVPFAFWLTATHRPATFVELGTHYGVSYFAFCQAVDTAGLATRCYAIDAWKGDKHAGEYGPEVFSAVRDHNERLYSRFSTLMPMRFDDGTEYFADGEIDLLHIDGYHTYEAAKHDFDTWLPKLSPRAIVVLHDTNERKGDFGVFRFADELRAQYPVVQFSHGHGLTIVAVGAEQRPEMVEFFRSDSDDAALDALQRVFSRLGRACAAEWTTRALKVELQELGRERSRLSTAVDEVRGQLSELEGAKASVEEALERRDGELTTVRANLAVAADTARRRTTELRVARRALAEKSTALAAAAKLAAQRKRELGKLRASTSWRVTAPLRRVSRGVRRGSAARPDAAATGTAKAATGTAKKAPAPARTGGVSKPSVVPELHARWYSRYYPDVAVSGLDATTHYAVIGLAEGRYATPEAFRRAEVPEFDAAWYLEENQDVARAGMDPLLHYAFHGRFENRAPSRPALRGSSITLRRSYHAWDHEEEKAFLARIDEVYREHRHEIDPILVSVVMPTYNRSGQITAAIRSVLAQSHQNLELIVADDGSTDDTEAVVAALDDPRIRYHKLAKQGVSGARNAGLAAATGEIVCYLDSDNTWTGDHVRHLVTFLARTDAAVAYSGLRATGDDAATPFYRGTHFDFEYCIRGNYIDLNAVGHRRLDLSKHRFDPDLKRFVDWDYLLRLTRDVGAVFLPYIGVEYYAGSRFGRITSTEHQGPELRELARKIQSRHALNGAPAPVALGWRQALDGPTRVVSDAAQLAAADA